MVAKNNSILCLAGLGLGCLMGVSGCLAGSLEESAEVKGAQEQIVVERSKAESPAWISLSPGILVDSGADLRLMTRRTKLLNLTLGLEQAEIAALDAMRLAMTEKIASTKAAKWQKLVFESVATVGDKKLKVQDIFYEGVDDRRAKSGSSLMHYYSVYVLISYAKTDLTAIYQQLASQLAVTGDADLRRLAVAVTRLSGKLP